MSLIFGIYLLSGKERLLDQAKRILKVFFKEEDYTRLFHVVTVAHHTFTSYIAGQCTEAVSYTHLLTQEGGEKEILVEKLLEFGYDKDHVLMIGDAPSDLEAAGKNGILLDVYKRQVLRQLLQPVFISHRSSWRRSRQKVSTSLM